MDPDAVAKLITKDVRGNLLVGPWEIHAQNLILGGVISIKREGP